MKNAFPSSIPADHPRIALIGDCPQSQDITIGAPFMGQSGSWLSSLLGKVGLERRHCFLGNLVGAKAVKNDITNLKFFSPEVQQGLAQLRGDLQEFQPDLVILLGGPALSLFTQWSRTTKSKVKGDKTIAFQPLEQKQFLEVRNEEKYLAAKQALHNLEGALQTLGRDLKKGELKKLESTQKKVAKAAEWKQKPNPLWTAANNWDKKCTPSIDSYRGTFFRSEQGALIENALCFATYHPSVITWEYDKHHIMQWDLGKALAHWEGWVPPERRFTYYETAREIIIALERVEKLGLRGDPLGFDIEGTVYSGVTCLSFAYTPNDAVLVPFINRAGKHLWTVEEEIELWTVISRILWDDRICIIGQNLAYEKFVLAWCYDIEVRNCGDTMFAQFILLCEFPKGLGFLNSLWTTEPYYKDERVGTGDAEYYAYNVKDSGTTLEIYQKQMEIISANPKFLELYLHYLEILPIAVKFQLDGLLVDKKELYKQLSFSLRRRQRWEKVLLGRFNRIAEEKGMHKLQSFNIDETSSKGTRQTVLYKILGLKPYLDRKTGRPKADKDTLYDISKREWDSKAGPLCVKMVRCSEVAQRFKNLNMEIDFDSRVRSSIRCPSTVTGRWASSASNTNSGKNLQTVDKKEKAIYLADPGHYLFQYDLSGADAWYIAAFCASIGDRTLLEDLQFGLKPAKLLRYALEHGPESIVGVSREELKRMSKLVPDDGAYVGCKAIFYGGSYGGGYQKLSAEQFKKSGGTVNIPVSTLGAIDKIQQLRYPGILQWKNWVASEIKYRHQLESPTGLLRVFHDKFSDAQVREALSHNPQNLTCYFANLALLNHYYGPLNQDGLVKVQFQTHDSLTGQFLIENTEIACARIKTAFSNEVEVHGIKISIPANGSWGPSWAYANADYYADNWEKVGDEVDLTRKINKI
jgi:uracil-DNA glycosylase family 4